MVELGADIQDAEVVLQVHLVGHVGRVEHVVELEGERLGPVPVLGADEVAGPELERVGFLVGRVRDGRHFGAEGVGEHDGEVAQSADADDGYLFARAHVGAHQG